MEETYQLYYPLGLLLCERHSKGYFKTLTLALGALLALPACSFLFDSTPKSAIDASEPDAAVADANASDASNAITEFRLEAENAELSPEDANLTMQQNRWKKETVSTSPPFEGTGYLVADLVDAPAFCAGDAILDDCSQRASYKITVEEAGNYYLHLKSWVENNGHDSVYYGVNGRPATGAGGADFVTLRCGTWGWQSVPTPIMFESAGEYTLNLWIRERGARIDQIVVNQSSEAQEPPGELCPDQ